MLHPGPASAAVSRTIERMSISEQVRDHMCVPARRAHRLFQLA